MNLFTKYYIVTRCVCETQNAPVNGELHKYYCLLLEKHMAMRVQTIFLKA